MSHSTYVVVALHYRRAKHAIIKRRPQSFELVSPGVLLGATKQTPRDEQSFVLSAEFVAARASFLAILRIPVRRRAGAIPQSNKKGTTGFSFDLCQLPSAPGQPPFRFASSLHRDATQVAAPWTTYRAASYDLAAPAGRIWWLASVGIGLGLLRSSISRCRAVYYPRGPTSVATSLRSSHPCHSVRICRHLRSLTFSRLR